MILVGDRYRSVAAWCAHRLRLTCMGYLPSLVPFFKTTLGLRCPLANHLLAELLHGRAKTIPCWPQSWH